MAKSYICAQCGDEDLSNELGNKKNCELCGGELEPAAKLEELSGMDTFGDMSEEY